MKLVLTSSGNSQCFIGFTWDFFWSSHAAEIVPFHTYTLDISGPSSRWLHYVVTCTIIVQHLMSVNLCRCDWHADCWFVSASGITTSDVNRPIQVAVMCCRHWNKSLHTPCISMCLQFPSSWRVWTASMWQELSRNTCCKLSVIRSVVFRWYFAFCAAISLSVCLSVCWNPDLTEDWLDISITVI